MKMRVFEIEIEVLDYVFFSTYEIGRNYFTGEFIGNWALAFAMGFAPQKIYSQNLPHFDFDIYQDLKDIKIKKYIFPARPKKDFWTKKINFTTQREFILERRAKNSQFPDFGVAKVICPHSKFITYIIDFEGKLDEKNPYEKMRIIRLGKWESQAKVLISEVEFEEGEGNFRSDHYLSWEDLKVKPKFFSSLPYSKPAKIIFSAYFENARYVKIRERKFVKMKDEPLFLPIEVGYLEGIDKVLGSEKNGNERK